MFDRGRDERAVEDLRKRDEKGEGTRLEFRERSMGRFWQRSKVETRGLEGFKERRMMDRQMKARERMKYEEVIESVRIEQTARGSLINV